MQEVEEELQTQQREQDELERRLRSAATSGDTDGIIALLDAGADIDAADATGRFTALHVASNNGHAAAVRLLLEAGAKVDVKTAGGSTPLRLAQEQSRAAVVAILQSL